MLHYLGRCIILLKLVTRLHHRLLVLIRSWTRVHYHHACIRKLSVWLQHGLKLSKLIVSLLAKFWIGLIWTFLVIDCTSSLVKPIWHPLDILLSLYRIIKVSLVYWIVLDINGIKMLKLLLLLWMPLNISSSGKVILGPLNHI